MINFNDSLNVLVLGGGVSGVAAALLLLDHGCHVTLADERDYPAIADKLTRVCSAGGEISAGQNPLPPGEFDLCVVSPAFASDHPWRIECQQRTIKVISELELGARFWKGRILAVTGSKGKSSIVKLCSDAMNAAGISASPAGNYGIPLSRIALEQPDLQWAVTEVSSFQMETTECFSPDIAILLNVQPDHLDRHGSIELYKNLKLRMFAAMTPGGVAIIHEDVDFESPLPSNVELIRFGVGERSAWQWADGRVNGRGQTGDVAVRLDGSWFNNPVFGISASAASAALLKAGLSVCDIEEAFRCFQPLEHRMEQFFCSRNGVFFVNDSKATSLTAMSAALKMIKTPVHLIAGGLLKEKLPENTKELLTHGVKKVYLIGDCCERMYQAWSNSVLCVKCGSLDGAVRAAFGAAESGETIVLSPGTASFDQFKNYCERGERFKDLVREVAN